MPIYTYKCACGEVKDVVHKLGERPEILCDACKEPMRRYATGGSGSYIKGPTASKYYMEERRRRKSRAQMSVTQLERYGNKGLIPNVNGEEVSSWKDAEKLAKEKGADTGKFKKYVSKEARSQNSAGIDEVRLRRLKEKAKNII
jgi:putative FmdB family regulatory protein